MNEKRLKVLNHLFYIDGELGGVRDEMLEREYSELLKKYADKSEQIERSGLEGNTFWVQERNQMRTEIINEIAKGE